MKILTINHHEAYLSSLAKTGHEFYVITRYGDLDLSWGPSSPPVPSNVTLIEFNDELRAKIKSGFYDLLICHTIKNLLWFFPYRGIHCIFVAHITLKYATLGDIVRSLAKRLIYILFSLTHKTRFVSISRLKYDSWFIHGEIIHLTPGQLPAPDQGKGYDRVIVVGNRIKTRGRESGYDMIEQIMRTLPLTIIGNNPDIDSAIKPKNRAEFVEAFRSGRIFLYTTRFPYNDGYNTAMLEAMRMGMAIVTVENPSSPIVHNQNGLVGKDSGELTNHLRYLLMNPKLVDELGQKARETIHQQFSEEAFIDNWNQVIESVMKQHLFRP